MQPNPTPEQEPSGLQIIRPRLWVPEILKQRIAEYNPKSNLGRIVRDILHFLPGPQAIALLDAVQRVVTIESALYVKIIRADGSIEDYGLVSDRLVTNNGVAWLVDSWENLLEPELMKFHGIGTGATAEAAADSALVTECTTALNPDSTRATGTLAEASANVFQSVGTNLLDANTTVTEHGLFNQAATGGGVLWDRSLTGSLALLSGDSIQTTYQATFAAGS